MVEVGGECEPGGCDTGLYCAGVGDVGEGVCEDRKDVGESCSPNDWNACTHPDEEAACDLEQETCELTTWPATCVAMNIPEIWH